MEERVKMMVENANSRALCSFDRVRTGEHTGYVHPSAGFSFTMSRRRPHGDQWVHDLHAFLDPQVEFDLTDDPELLAFLERCVPGARIGGVEVERFEILLRVGWFAQCLKEASRLPGWRKGLVWLRDAAHPETLHTMSLLASFAPGTRLSEDGPGFGVHVRAGRVWPAL